MTDRGITHTLHTLALLICSFLPSQASGSKIIFCRPSPIMPVGTEELTPPHHHAPPNNAFLLFLFLLLLLLARAHGGAGGVRVALVWPLHRLGLPIPCTTFSPTAFAHAAVVEGTFIMESRALERLPPKATSAHKRL
jgi:hypothetical protein